MLEINCNDIYNEDRRVEKECKAAAHANVCASVSPEMSKSFVVHNVSVVTATVCSNEASHSPLSASLTSIPCHEEAAILSGTSARESGNPPTTSNIPADSPILSGTSGRESDNPPPPPSDIVADSTIPQQNMGGWPKGSSNANKRKNEPKWKQAKN
jgi:hypothetical protein